MKPERTVHVPIKLFNRILRLHLEADVALPDKHGDVHRQIVKEMRAVERISRIARSK